MNVGVLLGLWRRWSEWNRSLNLTIEQHGVEAMHWALISSGPGHTHSPNQFVITAASHERSWLARREARRYCWVLRRVKSRKTLAAQAPLPPGALTNKHYGCFVILRLLSWIRNKWKNRGKMAQTRKVARNGGKCEYKEKLKRREHEFVRWQGVS